MPNNSEFLQLELTINEILCRDTAIYCEHCRSQNTKFFSLESYSRFEDALLGTHLLYKYSGDQIIIDSELNGNPSERRGGIKICFECEECKSKTFLSIAQHKGHNIVKIGGVKNDSI